MNAKSPLITLFKEQLENESRALAAANNLQKRGDFLIWWYFTKVVGLESPQIEEVVCDGSNDLGINAIWIDPDDIVHFYNFKNPENIDNTFPGGDVDKVLAGLNLILARGHHSIANPELRGRVEEIYQAVPAGYRLHLITSGSGISVESEAKFALLSTNSKAPQKCSSLGRLRMLRPYRTLSIGSIYLQLKSQ
jgi:hypothetical protein